MKIKSLQDINAFKEAISRCKGDVWLESVYGDRYNLKSACPSTSPWPICCGIKNGSWSCSPICPRTTLLILVSSNLALFGTYGDYGKVDLGKSESSFVKQIIAGFKVDGIGFELNTWDELEEAFHTTAR